MRKFAIAIMEYVWWVIDPAQLLQLQDKGECSVDIVDPNMVEKIIALSDDHWNTVQSVITSSVGEDILLFTLSNDKGYVYMLIETHEPDTSFIDMDDDREQVFVN